MAVFVTSDLHLGHSRVAEIRGFTSSEAHDSCILKNIRDTVPLGSTLYILGDIAMGGWRESIKPLASLVVRRSYTVHVVLGNHDRPAPNNSNGHAHLIDFMDIGSFDSVSTVAQISHGGKTILMSHYPYDGDHTEEERYDQFRLRDNGNVLLHGHTHSNERFSLSRQGTKQIHVGLDAWGLRPVSMGTINLELEKAE